MNTAEQPNSDVVELEGDYTSGSEHKVWLDGEKGLVYKIPSTFGKLWQVMSAEAAERDLDLMRQSGVAVVPTEVHVDAVVQNGTFARGQVAYLLRQPLFEGAQALTYAALHHSEDLQRQLFDLFLQGQEIRAKYKSGFDMLGGQIAKMFPPVIDPRMRPINPVIANLLVPQSDITAKTDLPQLGINKGATIAKEGVIRQCDTRMYNLDRVGLKGRILTKILSRVQEAQDTSLSALLESFGFETKFDTEANAVRRFIGYIFNKAIPKMRLYAEAVE